MAKFVPYMDFPGGSDSKATATMWETQVPSLGREDSPGEGNGNPLQYSQPEKSHGWGAW